MFAVIGVPDEKWGEAREAIRRSEPGENPTADDHSLPGRRTVSPGTTCPKTVDFVDVLAP